MQTPDTEWSFSVYVPESTTVEETVVSDDAATNHGGILFRRRKGHAEKIDGKNIESQWRKSVATLMKLGSTISDSAKEWEIDEIEVGMTLSAKGELLFIAEAGAEASIKFVLKKKTAH
tara:strand:+ start:5517 stop:5870 length:354 start_codon:yes stop_codon:yes gene_type:complete